MRKVTIVCNQAKGQNRENKGGREREKKDSHQEKAEENSLSVCLHCIDKT